MNERYMCRGKRLHGDDWIVGNLLQRGDQFLIIPDAGYDNINDHHEVDPATVEPVKVKVVCETADENGVEYEFAHYCCPNCKNIIHQHFRKSKEPMRYTQNYCVDCGQALDWDTPELMEGAE